MVVKKKVTKKTVTVSNKVFVSKTDLIGDLVSKYPEVAPLLAQAGLHCVGCHSSAYETIEQGLQVHGMNSKKIGEVIVLINKRVAMYNALPKISFTKKALEVLQKKIRAANSKYVRVVQVFGADFDFEPTNQKLSSDVEVGKDNVLVLLDARTERMLRGITIDYDSKVSDFVAKRAN